jgi:type III secretory pathway component EscR
MRFLRGVRGQIEGNYEVRKRYIPMVKTFKEHQQEASRARWAKKTEEERKTYSAMMNKKRWPDEAKNKENNPKPKSTSAPRIKTERAITDATEEQP